MTSSVYVGHSEPHRKHRPSSEVIQAQHASLVSQPYVVCLVCPLGQLTSQLTR
jgi:hypothetical protein